MADLKTEPKPTFFWQGALILLPVMVFAVLGVVFLKRDRDLVEQEALKNAGTLARQLAVFIGPKMEEQMQNRYLHALQVRDPNPPEGTHIAESSIWQETRDRKGESYVFEIPMPQYRRLQASFSPYRQGELWLVGPSPRLVVDENGMLLWPPNYPDVPTPTPDRLLQLTAAQQKLWESARQDTGQSVAAKWQELLATSPAPETTAIVKMKLAQALGSNGKKAEAISILSQLATNTKIFTTEIGLPLQPLASLEELRLIDPGLSEKIHIAAGVLATNALIWPSILSASFLDESARAWPGDPRSDMATARERWQVDEDTRDLYHELFEAGDLDNISRRGVAFWHHWRGHDWLMLRAPVGPTDAPHATFGTGYHVISEELIELTLLELMEQTEAVIPPYATVTFEIAGRTVGDPPAGQLLAETQLPNWKYVATTVGKFHASPVEVPNAWARVYLAKPEALFALQRQRSWMFGGLIVAALVAALAGWFAARRAFYRQLRLNEMKSNFVSSVSHELRAPIASVRLMAEGLECGKIAGAEKQNEYFKFIVQECRRLSSLIENVLDFSRIEQGRKQYEMEATDLVALTGQTVKLMETYAAERQVKITLEVKGNPVPVEIEGKSIQQALVNLIDNAVKHSPKGSGVTVGIDFAVPRVSLWVEDKGEGIPASEHERIFERFYRLGSELRRETQGVGIGLSIVKHIVEAHHGKIIVRSAPEQGSRFTIELPINQRKGQV